MVQRLADIIAEKDNVRGVKPRFCDRPNNSIQRLADTIAEKDNLCGAKPRFCNQPNSIQKLAVITA